ncbi:MAG TPA: hypothetical protein VNK04_01195 [Gemmataceae bacterium]|nr:hypothetical protein [Gemmataceae bacterium]
MTDTIYRIWLRLPVHHEDGRTVLADQVFHHTASYEEADRVLAALRQAGWIAWTEAVGLREWQRHVESRLD